MFDYLLMTEGMMRTATAQHWPSAKDMLIFQTPEKAIIEANHAVGLANNFPGANFRILSNETTYNPIWGPTSVRVRLQKGF